PSLVHVDRVRTYSDDFGTQFLELGVESAEFLQFGWTNKRKVPRIKDQDQPTTAVARERHLADFLLVECLKCPVGNCLSNGRHETSTCVRATCRSGPVAHSRVTPIGLLSQQRGYSLKRVAL